MLYDYLKRSYTFNSKTFDIFYKSIIEPNIKNIRQKIKESLQLNIKNTPKEYLELFEKTIELRTDVFLSMLLNPEGHCSNIYTLFNFFVENPNELYLEGNGDSFETYCKYKNIMWFKTTIIESLLYENDLFKEILYKDTTLNDWKFIYKTLTIKGLTSITNDIYPEHIYLSKGNSLIMTAINKQKYCKHNAQIILEQTTLSVIKTIDDLVNLPNFDIKKIDFSQFTVRFQNPLQFLPLIKLGFSELVYPSINLNTII